MAGKVAQDSGVKKLTLTHSAPSGGLVPDDIWLADAHQDFDGEVIVGKSLMEVGV